MLTYFKLICALAFLGFIGEPAAAQVAIPFSGVQTSAEQTLPDPLTPEAVRGLVARLSDAQVRALLLEQLDSVAEQTTGDASGGTVDFLQRALSGALGNIAAAIKGLPELWAQQRQSFKNFHARLGWSGIGTLFGALFVAILTGLVAEKIVNVITRRWHSVALARDHSQSLRDNLRFLFFRLCTDIYGLIAFFVVTRSIGVWLMPDGLESFAKVIMISLVVIPRLGGAFIRFLLAPDRPGHRLLNVDDPTAIFLHRHQVGLFLTMGFSIAVVSFNELNHVSMRESHLGFWLNLAVHLYFTVVIWRAWDGLVAMMRGTDPEITPNEEWFARIFPVYAIAVSTGTWILFNILIGFGQYELLQGAPHYQMVFVLTLLPALDALIRGLVRYLTPPMTGEGLVAERAHKATKRSYTRIGRIIIFAAVVLFIAEIWGLGPKTMAAAGVGAQFAGRFVEILIILATGYLVWEVVSLWINRKLAAEQTALGIDLTEDEPGGGEGGGAGGSRLSTVLPLLLGIAKSAIVMIFGLIALGNIGIDITPLLAGAGIVGLAVGFGAQRLVADIVSGIFFLVDDAFRIGEYVEIEGTVGSVEKISIRSMQLRHHKGPVHTIPYGEIPKITNYSRDWVIMKLKFTVPFDTDPNQVKKIFKKIGAEMLEIPEFAEDFLQPFKSQGVYDFDDVGMIIRGKFMAKPGHQFTLRKEIYNRVKVGFAQAGIDFARREVRVAIPGLENANHLSDTDKAAIAGAAAQVAQQQAEEMDAEPDKPGN